MVTSTWATKYLIAQMVTIQISALPDVMLFPDVRLSISVSYSTPRFADSPSTDFPTDFERDPVVDACSEKCINPSAFANLKCAYWGNPLIAGSAVVEGQWRRQFHAVIAGSNAYVNSTVLLDTAYQNDFINDVAIEAPLDCQGTDTFMGYVLFEDTPFDVRLCAAACTARTKYNRSQNNPRACNFWNTYILLQEGVAQGQYCSL